MSDCAEQKMVRTAVQEWVRTVVVGLDLCPFARREVEANTIRYAIADARTEESLIERLAEELVFLQERNDVETTLLIHPQVLRDFESYNDFLGLCDELLDLMQLRGEFQIASFHPEYRFAGTAADAPENYSNRSPYPLLHILREASVERAIARHPDIESVPVRNVARLRDIGSSRLRKLICPNP